MCPPLQILWYKLDNNHQYSVFLCTTICILKSSQRAKYWPQGQLVSLNLNWTQKEKSWLCEGWIHQFFLYHLREWAPKLWWHVRLEIKQVFFSTSCVNLTLWRTLTVDCSSTTEINTKWQGHPNTIHCVTKTVTILNSMNLIKNLGERPQVLPSSSSGDSLSSIRIYCSYVS